jgi:hypothetical protein
LSLIFLIYVFRFDVQAQKNIGTEEMPDSCEIISAYLDLARSKFDENGNPESYLIIIGTSAYKEKTRHNIKRIAHATKYLTMSGIKPEKIIFGAGQSLKKLGSLKFFVNGELLIEIKSRGNSVLCFGAGETFDGVLNFQPNNLR